MVDLLPYRSVSFLAFRDVFIRTTGANPCCRTGCRMEKLLGWSFVGKEQMTGLPEYRNGKLATFFVSSPANYLTSFLLRS